MRQCTAGVAFVNVLEAVLIICRVVVVRLEGFGAMRDWMADWRKWSVAERALAVAILMSMMAVPVGVLLGFTHPA